ncbi:hypothetical protein HBI70_027910 [Parastagonospora nodorum]|nr:hypothetical protein HBI13_212140 [Parastagonospora nodorum]KAH4239874.1 hypothetical protein HBI06_029270 [Parastagonospora nodorum]KAH4244650.1 hypothetical protein HBI05_073720 [Parastagonospora nodorum]KAH4392375.1 hypothetical protein HBH99_144760 [Parastagonospora nodorum]KAH4904787.1 hypothetical protein HBH74_178770 [Parastagonospora nodorum]
MHTYAIEDFAVPDAHGQALRLMHWFRFWTWQLMKVIFPSLSSIIADNVATSEDVCRWKYAMMLVSMFTCDKSPRISRSASRSDVLLMSFSPAEAHHMKPEYARRDQVIGSTMESS